MQSKELIGITCKRHCTHFNDFVVESKSFVAISKSFKHDTIAVHLFQRKLISFLKEEVGEISKIVYFLDGASSQYKNKKNFINLCCHEQDFGTTAEWHFFATSHGRGLCDGIGGTLKRLTAKANNQISTPNELFLCASENLHSIKVHFIAEKDYAEETMILKSHFAMAKQTRGTHNYHSFIPV
ncbi:hypothetical protein J437_LFUL018650 [Ladona fulva]|uniref:Uncharacterized protein n=1 Tax=Ladona fulva TaxID=123851 RepID=A0A8K0KQ29_LADFU|nr:hypothetical protein J437_LFUL018650 [Ladona fulva]